MTQNDDAEVQGMVAAEYSALGDVFSSLDEGAWETASLCEGWRTREVIAHLTMPARYDEAAFMAELSARDFDFDRLSNELAERDGELPAETLVANLRDETLHRWTPPGGGPLGALNHVVIHGLDAVVPLGLERRPPPEVMRVVLSELAESGHEHFGTKIAGRRLEATDLDWSFGSGPVLRGSAADLVLALSGRPVAERLEGEPLGR